MEAPNIHRSPEVNLSRKSNLISPLTIIANTPKIQIKTPKILTIFIFSLKKIVEIKIINNAVEQKPFYDIIEEESKTTNLTLVGIPNYKIEKQAEFVMKTNNLFNKAMRIWTIFQMR